MPLYSFGECEFDSRSGGLVRRGSRIRLRPQAAAVLSCLLERAGQLVSRRDLELVLWPEGTYVDFEDGLNACIKQIRAALSDDRVQPRYLETLPRRGYRLLAPVRTSDDHESRPPVVYCPCVVVLPFRCLMAEEVAQAFADGLTEEVTTRMALLRPARFSVSARPFGWGVGPRAQIPAAVDFALTGTVRINDRRFRIAAHLIALTDHRHLWAAAFDGVLDRMLVSQTRIAKKIIAGVVQSLHVERVPRRASMSA